MSVKKQFDQIKSQQKRREELQKKQEEEEKERLRRIAEEKKRFEAERIAKEKAFFEEHKRILISIIDETDIVKHLKEIKREFWKLGEIVYSDILTLKKARTTALCNITLEARWDALVEDEIYPKNSYIFEEYRSLVVTLIVYKSGAYIQVGNYTRFKYHGDRDIEKIHEHLAWNSIDRENELPYSRRKREEAERIRKFKLWHPFTRLEKRAKGTSEKY